MTNKNKFMGISGIFLAILMTYFSCQKIDSFLAFKPYGIYLFIAELILCICIAGISFLQKKLEKKRTQKLYSFILLLIAPLVMEFSIELLNGNMLWDIDMFGNVLINYLINLMFYVIFFICTGSLKWSIRSISILLECFGIANMYVKDFKGSPLLPWDLGSLRTAAGVAGSYTYTIGFEILLSITAVILLWKLAYTVLPNSHSHRFKILRLSGGLICGSILLIFYDTDLISETLGATPDFFNQTRGYESKGAMAEFIINTKYMSLKEPKNYDSNTLDIKVEEYTKPDTSILKKALTEQNVPQDKIDQSFSCKKVKDPNVIVIMNESYSDLSVIGDFDTNQDYMPYVNQLRNEPNVIEGNAYVSTIGTGTSNTEYEFLTGNSMAFLPYGSNAYQLYVDHPTPTLVSTLEDQGYSSAAFHPYYRGNWNRPAVYDNFGFNSYTGMEDMHSFHRLRRYISDETDFYTIQEMYENRDPSEPFFLFNVTMQNHSSYDQEDKDFNQEIVLENMKGEYPETEQYLSLIKKTDEAFMDLITYFKQQEDPTIILMYGDHQPFIEDSFYEEVMGSPLNRLSDEENQKRYITRFVMWANYDIPEGWIDHISVNYLSTLLAQVAGFEQTPYMNYLSTLYQKVPVITALGCRDWNNTYFKADEKNPYQEDLDLYNQASYNLLREEEKRSKTLFYLRKKENP